MIPEAGDHASWWETSLLLALRPDCVDMSRLAADAKDNIGTMGKRPPQEGSREDGERGLRTGGGASAREGRRDSGRLEPLYRLLSARLPTRSEWCSGGRVLSWCQLSGMFRDGERDALSNEHAEGRIAPAFSFWWQG